MISIKINGEICKIKDDANVSYLIELLECDKNSSFAIAINKKIIHNFIDEFHERLTLNPIYI